MKSLKTACGMKQVDWIRYDSQRGLVVSTVIEKADQGVWKLFGYMERMSESLTKRIYMSEAERVRGRGKGRRR